MVFFLDNYYALIISVFFRYILVFRFYVGQIISLIRNPLWKIDKLTLVNACNVHFIGFVVHFMLKYEFELNFDLMSYGFCFCEIYIFDKQLLQLFVQWGTYTLHTNTQENGMKKLLNETASKKFVFFCFMKIY